MLDSGQLMIMLNTIGLAVLTETFRSASFLFLHTNGHNSSRAFQEKMKESKIALMFIQGSGLEAMLNYYHMAYDPFRIRERFYRQVHSNLEIGCR